MKFLIFLPLILFLLELSQASPSAVPLAIGVLVCICIVRNGYFGGGNFIYPSGNNYLAYPPLALSPVIANLPSWIQLGCGNDEYYCKEKGAIFPAENCPNICPDLKDHNNLMVGALKKFPGMYDKYKNQITKNGVSFAKCIKTGMDNKGHTHITICGLVAGDEESYEKFKDMFDYVISERHGGYAPDAKHATDMDIHKISKTQIDPSGRYVLSTRCRAGRSVRGFPLPPSCSFLQRRELERIVVKVLNQMSGDLKGKYYGLHGSESPVLIDEVAMDEVNEQQLRDSGNLFQEPNSTLLLSSGCGRHWPDARGIYHNDAKNFFVWLNEEDHMRIISMEKGDNIRAVFERFVNSTRTIQRILENEGKYFMHNQHLGYISTCPSNLGTGLRAGAMVKIPLFSGRKDFKKVLGKIGLQARGIAGVDSASKGGTWDISNADRLGKSEVRLVNIFIEGIAQIIKWEQRLERGQDIEDEILMFILGSFLDRLEF